MTSTLCLGNGSAVIEFLFLGFPIPSIVKHIFFLLLLIMYIVIVVGNVLIIVTVSSNDHLHTPMYFFLVILSLLELWYTSSISPTLLGTLLKGQGIIISFHSCIAQFFFVCLLACNENFILMLMAFDRYLAICYPLHYTTMMGIRLCMKMITAVWLISCGYSFGTSFSMSMLTFSGLNELDHFFCDFAPLLNVACSDIYVAETEVFITALIVTLIPFIMISVSYAYIILTILRIPSATGRRKAFSTCSSHLIVVITYFGTLIIVYGIPNNAHSLNLSKSLSLLYTVATPLLNPIIYTLRNKDIREALKKGLHNISL